MGFDEDKQLSKTVQWLSTESFAQSNVASGELVLLVKQPA